MMLSKIFFLLIVFIGLLHASNFNKNYYISTNDINLSIIVPHVSKDIILYSLNTKKHTKRIKSKHLIKKLKLYGYDSFTSKYSYIKFTKLSPINTSKIKNYIKEIYSKTYLDIKIKNISIFTRSYISSLPQNYTINMQEKSSLYKDGTLYIKTAKNKKIFFDYNIDATINVYVTKHRIKRGTELSLLNCVKKNIILNKFKSKPIQNLQKNTIQSKKSIKTGDVITFRDIQKLSIVKRGSFVTIILKEKGIALSFSAKAKSNAKLGDTITVQRSNGKKLRVVVIGKNMAEVR